MVLAEIKNCEKREECHLCIFEFKFSQCPNFPKLFCNEVRVFVDF